MKPNLPVWRSLLYVPANVERFVEKAHTRGADCIQLDLEDSVPASEKDAARQMVPAAAKRVRRAGADVVVRINSPMEITVQDLDASVGADVDGIAVTKVEIDARDARRTHPADRHDRITRRILSDAGHRGGERPSGRDEHRRRGLRA
jgi:citrate lyase beta subunit